MKGGPRKLLVAAVGVATINYVGCGKSTTTPNDTKDAELIVTSGNLPTAEPYVPDAAPVPTAEPTTTTTDAGKGPGRRDGGAPPTSGNLPAPIPDPRDKPTPKKK